MVEIGVSNFYPTLVEGSATLVARVARLGLKPHDPQLKLGRNFK